MVTDRNKNIEQITQDVWKDPGQNSYLVRTCHALRKKPLKDFTIEDLRIMIGQRMNLDLLMPLAIEVLDKDIQAEGDYYPGDLLNNVLNVPGEYWKSNKHQWEAIKEICDRDFHVFNDGFNWKSLSRVLEQFYAVFNGLE